MCCTCFANNLGGRSLFGSCCTMLGTLTSLLICMRFLFPYLDVLQECRNQNQKLTEFLSAPENVKQLLDYVTREPAGAIDDRQRFKFPNVASEILTTDTQGIMQVRSVSGVRRPASGVQRSARALLVLVLVLAAFGTLAAYTKRTFRRPAPKLLDSVRKKSTYARLKHRPPSLLFSPRHPAPILTSFIRWCARKSRLIKYGGCLTLQRR